VASDSLVGNPSHRFKVFFVNVFASRGRLESELDNSVNFFEDLSNLGSPLTMQW